MKFSLAFIAMITIVLATPMPTTDEAGCIEVVSNGMVKRQCIGRSGHSRVTVMKEDRGKYNVDCVPKGGESQGETAGDGSTLNHPDCWRAKAGDMPVPAPMAEADPEPAVLPHDNVTAWCKLEWCPRFH